MSDIDLDYEHWRRTVLLYGRALACVFAGVGLIIIILFR
jgi:hypothetical protein